MNINTKIKLKNISLAEMIAFISSIHQVEVPSKILTLMDHGRMIHMKDIIAYQIRDNGFYEYIYEANRQEFYIHIESNHKTHEIIEKLIKNQWIDDNHYLHLTNKPLKITSLTDLLNVEGTFLIVYLHQNDYSEKLYQQLASKLKGVAYVVYGDDMMDEVVCQHYGIHQKSFALMFNHDILNLRYSTEKELTDLLISQIERYMNQRVYDYPFSFKQLHKQVLMDMLHEESMREKQNMFDHDVIMNDLKMKQESLLERIEKKEQEIENLKIMIEIAKAQLESKQGCPIMFKGKEKDLYPNEQKDILITILKEEYERIKDSQGEERKKELILNLLNLNPESGTRVKYLENLRILLEPVTRNLSPKELEQLKHLGFNMSKGEGHYKGNFFEDSRYSLTISSSASDANAGHVTYRRIRNDFF